MSESAQHPEYAQHPGFTRNSGFARHERTINGVRTAVLTAGSGPPVVFLHGATASLGFDALLPLAEQHRLIVPIHPGFGSSDDDTSVDNIHDYRRHYLDLFDELDIHHFVLIGHSLGGYLASVFAMDHPERVRRLVLAAPLGLRVPEAPATDLFAPPSGQLALPLTEHPAEAAHSPTPDVMAEQYRELSSAARLLWESPYDLKLPKWAHRLTMPTLLLWGDSDQVVPVAHCAEWQRLVPAAESTTLPEVGHLLFTESTEPVTAVERFLVS